MRRVFTKDFGDDSRYKAGVVKDYPRDVWQRFFPGFEKFTKPADEAPQKTSEKLKLKQAAARAA